MGHGRKRWQASQHYFERIMVALCDSGTTYMHQVQDGTEEGGGHAFLSKWGSRVLLPFSPGRGRCREGLFKNAMSGGAR